jgi:hypothetical protein
MIVIALLVWIGILALRAEPNRRLPLAIFVTPAILFQLFEIFPHPFPKIADFYYYFVAAALDLLVMLVLRFLADKSRLVVFLVLMSGLSIVLNILFNIVYYGYIDTIYYDCVGIAFYSIVIFFSWWGDRRGILRNPRPSPVLSGIIDLSSGHNIQGHDR